MFEPPVVDPVVDFLVELPGDGAALELGIGTGRGSGQTSLPRVIMSRCSRTCSKKRRADQRQPRRPPGEPRSTRHCSAAVWQGRSAHPAPRGRRSSTFETPRLSGLDEIDARWAENVFTERRAG
jgi:hypothetical protein